MPIQEPSLSKGNHHHLSHSPNFKTQIRVSTVCRIPWKEEDRQRRDLMGTCYLLCWRRQRKGGNSSHHQGQGSQGFLNQRKVSTSLPPETIAPVFVSDSDEKSIHIPIFIFVNEGAQIIDTFALVDSGATGDFIDQDLAKKRGYQLQRLSQLLKAQNVDGSANQGGIIHHKVTLHLQITKTEEKREFLVVNCGQENLILGLSWLREINPLIDWTTGEVTIFSIPRTPQHDSPATITQWYLIHYLGMDPDHKIAYLWKKRMNRYAKEAYPIRKTTLAMELVQQMKKPKAKLP